MRAVVRLKSEKFKKMDCLIVGCYEGEATKLRLPEGLSVVNKDLVAQTCKRKSFEGKKNESCYLSLHKDLQFSSIAIFGLGKKQVFDLETLRKVVGRIITFASAEKMKSILIDFKTVRPSKTTVEETAEAIQVAYGLKSFRFVKYRSTDVTAITPHLSLWFNDPIEKKEALAGTSAGDFISQAANIARDLAEEPANILTPREMANRAKAYAKDAELTIKVLEPAEIKKLGMNSFLSVASGSKEPARFIVMETKYNKKSELPICLVGKGITFDSGGISIKPARGMDEMKYDMSGAAAVIATLWLAGKMKIQHKIIGIIPTCENMVSESPSRPGDVVKAMNGKSIAILNTDAEGRLILADALCYAHRYKPRYIIDLATLTGACSAALGEYAIGGMGNNKGLMDGLKEAAQASGERIWEFPLYDEYREHIRGTTADLNNIGKGVAGAQIGGVFLEEFVGDFPWAHLDIASTAWLKEDHGYMGKGPSGAGVRLLASFLRKLPRK